MLVFLLERVLQCLLVLLAVALIAFLLFQYVGDPVLFILGQDATEEQVGALRESLGLDQPALVQFGYFLLNAIQGEFGLSLRQGIAVSTLIAERLPATLELAIVAAIIALVVGIPMGVYAAIRRGSALAQVFMAISLLGVSLPTFLIGIFLILIFSVALGILPSFGRGEVTSLWGFTTGLFGWGGIKHLILPSITLAIFQLTLIMRLVRTEMLEVLRMDYIRFARARGLGGLIAFAIITETVFQWPGMGLLFIQAVNFADIPVMAAYLCLISVIFVVINLIVDLLYFTVDPRLRVRLG